MSNELSWEVIDTFFKDNKNFIIEHHLSSYNHFFLHIEHQVLLLQEKLHLLARYAQHQQQLHRISSFLNVS